MAGELTRTPNEIGQISLDVPKNIDFDRRVESMDTSDAGYKSEGFNPDNRIEPNGEKVDGDNLRNGFDPDKRAENTDIRDLTDEEKQVLTNRLDWTPGKIDKFNAKIDSVGTLYIDTQNEELEGGTADNGVPFFRKVIEINGVKINGVFPEFNSKFNTYLSQDKLRSASYSIECNKILKEAITKDPAFGEKFTPEQRTQIENDITPEGYVWHHNEESGMMQLVKEEDHQGASHTGGAALWGCRANNIKKGVSF